MKMSRLQKSLLCGVLLILTTVVMAQETKTWTGAASNNWAEAANWQPAGEPQSSANVVIKKAANGNQPILRNEVVMQNLNIELGASLTINGQRLQVTGDLKIGTSGIAIDHLVMTNPSDEVIVNGNATFAARTKLEAGRIVVRGNLAQDAVNIALQPTNTVFVLAGTAPQTVRFQRPGISGQSFFTNLIVSNPAGVTFLSDVHITGALQLENGGRLAQRDSVGTYFYQQLPRTENGEYRVQNSFVAGKIVMQQDCALPHAENDLTILARNALTLNGHRLHVGGNFTVKAYGDQKHLILAEANDVLEIAGDAVFEGSSTLTAGIISLRGNLAQRVSSAALQPAGTVFVFEGNAPQIVSFERPGVVNRSYLHEVRIKNAAGVNFASEVYITGKMSLEAGSMAQSAALGTYFTTALPKIVSGEYAIANSYVAGPVVVEANLTLPRAENHLTILPRQALTLNGHTLRVGGNFTVKVFEDYQHLFMTQTTDTLAINGNAEFQGQSQLAAGAIVLKGNLSQKISGKSLQPTGTHFFFNGTTPQSVNFEKPGTGLRSYLKDATLRNPAGVVFTSDIFIAGQLRLEAGTKLEQGENFGTNFTNALPQIENANYAVRNTNVAGALVMNEDLQLTTPSANLTILPKQSLTLNGHTLEIGGNFKASAFSAEKHLIMNQTTDRLVINGDATFEGLNVLQAGSIVLRGNLLQSLSAAALQPEGTAFVFDGKAAQMVSFERPGLGSRSYLREVTINREANVRLLTDVYVTGQINNYGKVEVIDTRSLFLSNAEGINHQGGTLVGNGTVHTPAKSFTNDGNMRPGSPSGVMRITGSYVQSRAGKLTIMLAGQTLAAQHSRLDVTSNAILDGALELELAEGFKASVGDSFRVLTFNSATGRFQNIVSTLPRSLEFQAQYKNTSVEVIVVPSVNRAPVAQNDSAITRRNTALTLEVLRNDTDDNDDVLQISALDLTNTTGQAALLDGRSILYTPKENFSGWDTFDYTASDGRGGYSTATVFVHVENTNRAPSAFHLLQPQNGQALNPVAPVHFKWQAAQDADNDSLSYSVRLLHSAGDTTIANIKGTELRLQGKDYLRGGRVYQWFVRASDGEFNSASVDTFNFNTEIVSGVAGAQGELPETFALAQNYPNPFNPTTTIGFALPQAIEVTLTIFNSAGQLVKQLLAEKMPAGRHNVSWDATNRAGEKVASGMYMYVIKAGDITMQRKLMLMK